MVVCSQSAVFGLSSCLPLLVGGGSGLVYKSVGNADLLLDHFDSKQCKESVYLPLTCYTSLSLIAFAVKGRVRLSISC